LIFQGRMSARLSLYVESHLFWSQRVERMLKYCLNLRSSFGTGRGARQAWCFASITGHVFELEGTGDLGSRDWPSGIKLADQRL